MDLAVNYSPQIAHLIQTNQIQVDFLKTPPWPDMIAEARQYAPITVHFELRAGSGLLHQTDWREIEQFLTLTGTRYVNLHLNAAVDDFPSTNGGQVEPSAEQVAERLIQDTQAVVRHFGAGRVIVENIPYRRSETHKAAASVDPQVISSVVSQTGCGLLLDISHARIAAQALEMPAWDYLAALPVQSLRELHFTGIHDWNGYQQDHLSILEQDWPFLERTLAHIAAGEWGAAHMLAFEYGGIGPFFKEHTDSEVLRQQVPALYQIVHTVNA